MNHFARTDRDLTWIHIAFLFVVSMLPFSTSLLSAFIHYRTALLLYWLNMSLLGAVLTWSWRYARGAGLLKPEADEAVSSAVYRRILIAQVWFAAGAAPCVVNTYCSIAVFVLVQLQYAVAAPVRFGFGGNNRRSV